MRPSKWPASMGPPPTMIGGHVEAHGGHEHAGDDLVAVRHEDEGVEGVGHGHDSTESAMSSRLGSE